MMNTFFTLSPVSCAADYVWECVTGITDYGTSLKGFGGDVRVAGVTALQYVSATAFVQHIMFFI